MLSDPQYGCAVIPHGLFAPRDHAGCGWSSCAPYAREIRQAACIIAWIPERLEGPGACHAESVPDLVLFRSMRRMMQRIGSGTNTTAPAAGRAAAAARPRAALAALPGGEAVLMEAEAKTLFAKVGVPVVEERRAATAEAAAAEAASRSASPWC